MKSIMVILSLLLVLTACNSKEKKETSSVKFNPPVVAADNELLEKAVNVDIAETNEPGNLPNENLPLLKDQSGEVDNEKKIIKEGEISFESRNVIETRKQILSELKKINGYVDDDKEDTNDGARQKEYVLSIRIPAKNFDAFISTVSSTATKIDSKNIRVKDVTTQFIDTKARLANKQILETRYLDLLKKGTRITDLLAIENKLSEIRSDIESTQNQLNYLTKQVEFSSLTITFYTRQAEQIASGNGFGYKFKEALFSGFESLQNIFFSLISVWPLWFGILVLYIVVKIWKRRRASLVSGKSN